MKLEYLEKWTASPVAGRRRKALAKIRKEAMRGQYNIEKLFDIANKLVNDEDWSVRSVALKTITEIALVNEKFLNKAVEILEGALEDTHSNVIMTALDGLAKLYPKASKKLGKKKIEKILNLLSHDMSNVREATVRLLVHLAKSDEGIRDQLIDELMERFTSEDAPNVLHWELKAFSELVNYLHEDSVEKIWQKLAELRRNISPHVRSEAVNLAIALVRSGKRSIDDVFKELIKKSLRDTNVVVKYAAVAGVSEIISRAPRESREHLEILGKEVLLKEKNERLIITILEMLDSNVHKIPEDIINGSELPRVLDILERNTHPKSPEKARIKELSRRVLEEKLGYTFEKRMKKFLGKK